jgi:stress-induced morphogen
MSCISGRLVQTPSLPPAYLIVLITDVAPGGCGQRLEVTIVSPQFAKKTTLQRHRAVNGALKNEVAAIHAWTIKCHTPEEWERKKPQ